VVDYKLLWLSSNLAGGSGLSLKKSDVRNEVYVYLLSPSDHLFGIIEIKC